MTCANIEPISDPVSTGTSQVNGLIELHRRVARGFRDREHYRLRMLLVGGGLATLIPT